MLRTKLVAQLSYGMYDLQNQWAAENPHPFLSPQSGSAGYPGHSLHSSLGMQRGATASSSRHSVAPGVPAASSCKQPLVCTSLSGLLEQGSRTKCRGGGGAAPAVCATSQGQDGKPSSDCCKRFHAASGSFPPTPPGELLQPGFYRVLFGGGGRGLAVWYVNKGQRRRGGQGAEEGRLLCNNGVSDAISEEKSRRCRRTQRGSFVRQENGQFSVSQDTAFAGGNDSPFNQEVAPPVKSSADTGILS